MIKEEIIEINGKEFVKHTTDKVRFRTYIVDGIEKKEPLPCLVQVETGNLYFDAIDIKPCPYTYVEVEAEENEA